MYRFIFWGLLTTCAQGNCQHQQSKNTFEINGYFSNQGNTSPKVFLIYRQSGKEVKDSVISKNGYYHFVGKIDEPAEAFLRLPNRQEKTVAFFLDTGKTRVVTDTSEEILIVGSVGQQQYEELNRQLEPVQKELRIVLEKYGDAAKKKNNSLADFYLAETYRLSRLTSTVAGLYALQHPGSRNALDALSIFATGDFWGKVDSIEKIVQSLSPDLAVAPSTLAFKKRLQIAKRTQPGQYAPAFTLPDKSGKMISLSSKFKAGRYLLIDFWASWCGPCRAQNPDLVALFEAYHSKGFTILGVSLDKKEEKANWLSAIQKDHLNWTHVSDLRYWENAAAKLYGVNAIPFNILVNNKGMIVGRALSPLALTEFLQKNL